MIRKARIADVVEIQKMLRDFAETGSLLARSLSELYTTLRDIVVFEDETGRIAGCCGLHIVWEDLAEIRSLAVLEISSAPWDRAQLSGDLRIGGESSRHLQTICPDLRSGLFRASGLSPG